MPECFLEDTRGDFVLRYDKPVMHPFSFTPRRRNPRLSEIRQVPRNFGLAHLQNFHEVANANLPIRDQVQQPEPGGVRQCPKEKMQ